MLAHFFDASVNKYRVVLKIENEGEENYINATFVDVSIIIQNERGLMSIRPNILQDMTQWVFVILFWRI